MSTTKNPARRTLPCGNQGPIYEGGKHGGMRAEARRREASERQAEADVRDPVDQIRKLDKKLGVGVGAKRERAKLDRKIP